MSGAPLAENETASDFVVGVPQNLAAPDAEWAAFRLEAAIQDLSSELGLG
jgi:hypothetical protein